MLNLDLLDGFSCYKNLICILLIERELRTPVVDNLSRLENVLDDPLPIDDSFPDEQLAAINVAHITPRNADNADYIVVKYLPPSFTYQQKKKILL